MTKTDISFLILSRFSQGGIWAKITGVCGGNRRDHDVKPMGTAIRCHALAENLITLKHAKAMYYLRPYHMVPLSLL